MEIRDNGAEVAAGWEFDRLMVSNNGMHQVKGNPLGPPPAAQVPQLLDDRDAPRGEAAFSSTRSTVRTGCSRLCQVSMTLTAATP